MITVDVDALAGALAERLQLEERPWIGIAEAAEYLGVSERWIRYRLEEIPHSRVDSKLFFNRNDLDDWLRNHQPNRRR